ncbi:hypothetical protein L9F63_010366, partial [Diploptera punctata]
PSHTVHLPTSRSPVSQTLNPSEFSRLQDAVRITSPDERRGTCRSPNFKDLNEEITTKSYGVIRVTKALFISAASHYNTAMKFNCSFPLRFILLNNELKLYIKLNELSHNCYK